MNLWGTIDLSGYFGTEIRIIDGEEYICIPRRFNPTILNLGGHRTALLKLLEHPPDPDGYTHAALPHIPKKLVPTIAAADFVKMTQPVGKFKVLGTQARLPKQESAQSTPGLDHTTLATNPVGFDDIPI